MRGRSVNQPTMLNLMDPEAAVPQDHPIRAIKKLVDEVLVGLGPQFDAMYSVLGRASIPPEALLKGQLLMSLYSVRSERHLCEQLRYNLLFRWFLDLPMDGENFDASTFSKNRERMDKHQIAKVFFARVVGQAGAQKLLSSEHFSVDGTLIEACASLKSFKAKDGSSRPSDDDDKGNPNVDFHGEKRSNQTHESTTDKDARLARKSNGTTAKLCYAGHGLMENRNGLLVGLSVTAPSGTAERDAAEALVNEILPGERRVTLGADKGYDTADFVAAMRHLKVTPHVAANTKRKGGSAIDGRTTRHKGYALSQRLRKRIEEIWGWFKTVGGLRRTRFRGLQRVTMQALFTGAAYNLTRMAKLLVNA